MASSTLQEDEYIIPEETMFSTGDTFVKYMPKYKIIGKDLYQHPTPVVESVSLSSVSAPVITYQVSEQIYFPNTKNYYFFIFKSSRFPMLLYAEKEPHYLRSKSKQSPQPAKFI